jgi:hypothetical protein
MSFLGVQVDIELRSEFNEFELNRDRLIGNLQRFEEWFFRGNGARGIDAQRVRIARNTMMNLAQTSNRTWMPTYARMLQLAGSLEPAPVTARTGVKLIVETSESTHTIFCQQGDGMSPQKIAKLAILPDDLLSDVLMAFKRRLGADQIVEHQRSTVVQQH